MKKMKALEETVEQQKQLHSKEIKEQHQKAEEALG